MCGAGVVRTGHSAIFAYAGMMPLELLGTFSFLLPPEISFIVSFAGADRHLPRGLVVEINGL
jgi:hypothetical protein